MNRQERIAKYGEVFTPRELINEILDKLSESLWIDSSRTFLDNSCGNGNFLVEVLKRKLRYGHNPAQALSTIYGVDIMKDNIEECRERLLHIANVHYKSRYEFTKKRNEKIINRNIVCADALTYDYSFK